MKFLKELRRIVIKVVDWCLRNGGDSIEDLKEVVVISESISQMQGTVNIDAEQVDVGEEIDEDCFCDAVEYQGHELEDEYFDAKEELSGEECKANSLVTDCSEKQSLDFIASISREGYKIQKEEEVLKELQDMNGNLFDESGTLGRFVQRFDKPKGLQDRLLATAIKRFLEFESIHNLVDKYSTLLRDNKMEVVLDLIEDINKLTRQVVVASESKVLQVVAKKALLRGGECCTLISGDFEQIFSKITSPIIGANFSFCSEHPYMLMCSPSGTNIELTVLHYIPEKGLQPLAATDKNAVTAMIHALSALYKTTLIAQVETGLKLAQIQSTDVDLQKAKVQSHNCGDDRVELRQEVSVMCESVSVEDVVFGVKCCANL